MNEVGTVDYLCAAYLVQCVALENAELAQARSIAAVAETLAYNYGIAIPESVQGAMLERLAADGVVEPVDDAYAKGFFFASERGLRDAWQRLAMRKGSIAANAKQLGDEWLKQVFASADFAAALEAAGLPGEEAAVPTRPDAEADAEPEAGYAADEAGDESGDAAGDEPADASPDGEPEATEGSETW